MGRVKRGIKCSDRCCKKGGAAGKERAKSEEADAWLKGKRERKRNEEVYV